MRFLVDWAGFRRARRIAAWLEPVIAKGQSVLDVGAGLGHIGQALRARHEVVTVDPRWDAMGRTPHVRASAEALPFEDRSFDVVLLAFVLHHMDAKLHARALAEAARVARAHVVLLEDTFRTRRERRYAHVVDSVLNAEFFGHPHSNRTSDGWRAALDACGLQSRVMWERRERWLGIFSIRHALLVGDVAPTSALRFSASAAGPGGTNLA